MELTMGRRSLTVVLLFAFVFAGAAAASTSKPVSWAAPQIRAVTAAGLMGAPNLASFHADDPLTAQALEDLAFGLKERLRPAPRRAPGRPDLPRRR